MVSFRLTGERVSLRWSHLLLIFLAALTLRGAFVLTRPSEIVYPDAVKYDYLARHLLATGQYQEQEGRQASRAPGYPLFLAAMYKIGLDSPRAVGLVQALLDALMCVVLALLGKRVFDASIGAVAGWMAALYPFFIYFTWLLLAETAFTLCLVALFLVLIRIIEATPTCAVSVKSPISNRQSVIANHPFLSFCGLPLLAVTAGLLCGALVLLRSSFFLMPFFLLPFLLLSPGARWRRAAAWGVMVVVMALALTPWTLRNYRIFHRVIPTTLQVGESLYEACSPYADGGPAMDRIDWEKERGGRMGEYENNEFFKKAALQYMRENPGRCLKLAAVKFVRFWNILPNYAEFRSPPLRHHQHSRQRPDPAAGVAGAVAMSRVHSARMRDGAQALRRAEQAFARFRDLLAPAGPGHLLYSSAHGVRGVGALPDPHHPLRAALRGGGRGQLVAREERSG